MFTHITHAHRNNIIALRCSLFDAVKFQSSSETISHWATCQHNIDALLEALEKHDCDCNREWQIALNLVDAEKQLDQITIFG